MTSRELVAKTIRGENPGPTPVYGWVRENLKEPITEAFGSVEAFEDHYSFDMAHLFGGPGCFGPEVQKLKEAGEEITPEVLLQIPLAPVDRMEDYQNLKKSLDFYSGERERFCYVQTNGFFECYNDPFGIENHLMYLALYPDEIAELYARQAKWNIAFAKNCLELGADMVHVSDDWGAQNSLMFSPTMFRELIKPYHAEVGAAVKKMGGFLSLHSDGNVMSVLDDIVEIGYDIIHPFQEEAGMDYGVYLDRYSDKFGILGGLCIQSTLGFGDYERLESEIRRVFGLLKGKRWCFCTTHFVQDHCSIEELVFAYDLVDQLRG